MKEICFFMGMLLLIVSAGCNSLFKSTEQQITIVPAPLSQENQKGYFTFSEKTRCSVENEMQHQVATQFFSLFGSAAGFKSEVVRNNSQANIILATDSTLGEDA